jgi:hypothetical protein
MLRRANPAAPRLHFTHAGDAMRSPGEINVNASDYAGKKVVLIARHPGDIAVSRYHHLRNRSRDPARRRLADQPIASFVWAEEGGIPSIVAFLNQFAAVPGVTIVRYADFIAEPEQSLRKLADAIGLDVDDEDIADAVAFGSLPNLKQLEREGYFTSSRLRQSRAGDEKSGKVRKGVVGGYRGQLEPAAVARIDDYLAEALDPRLGL